MSKKEEFPKAWENCRYAFAHSIQDNCCSNDDVVQKQLKLSPKERSYLVVSEAKDKNGKPYKDGKKYLVLFPDNLTRTITTIVNNHYELLKKLEESGTVFVKEKTFNLSDKVTERMRCSALSLCTSCQHYELTRWKILNTK